MRTDRSDISRSSRFPKWYWTAGLHDARILSLESFEFPRDYDQYHRRKDHRNRNLLTLNIDAGSAVYDTSVTAIHLFNYEILSDPFPLKNTYWLSDRLTKQAEGHILEIDLQNSNTNPADFTLIIQFERAEVDRK